VFHRRRLMKLHHPRPILYLITRGATTEITTPDSLEFKQIVEQVSAATDCGFDLIQLREKRLPAGVLFELTRQAVALTQGTPTRLVVNDRADIAAGVGADGVHLTQQSIDAATIRRTFGENFLIGASTHSVAEARTARKGGADFIVFGPVFETASKREYGAPVGVDELSNVTRELADFPVVALGGMTMDNFALCLNAGARGVAGIGLFSQPQDLESIAARIKNGVA
jgi:thiamine-phosphate pyrophosphorylase